MFENGKENISQLIFCRLFTDLYHSKFSRISQFQNIIYRKNIEILILTLLPHLPLSYLLGGADRKFPMEEIARARIVTDEETEISQ